MNINDPKDGSLDGDKDGYLNGEEFLNSTDPKAFIDEQAPCVHIWAATFARVLGLELPGRWLDSVLALCAASSLPCSP
jgi:hypothetical protein